MQKTAAFLLAVTLAALLVAPCVQSYIPRPDRCCRYSSCALDKPSQTCLVEFSCDIRPGCDNAFPGFYHTNKSVCNSDDCTRAGQLCWSVWFLKPSRCVRTRYRQCCDAYIPNKRINAINCRGWKTGSNSHQTESLSYCTSSNSNTNSNYGRLVAILCSIVIVMLIIVGILFIRFKSHRRLTQHRTHPFTVEGFRSSQQSVVAVEPAEPVLPPSYEEVSRTAHQQPPPAYEEAVSAAAIPK